MPSPRAFVVAAWFAALAPAQRAPRPSRSLDIGAGAAAALAGRSWPMGRIPDAFDESVAPPWRRVARAAMDEWEAAGGGRFAPRRGLESWIRIRAAAAEDRSRIGRLGGTQALEIAFALDLDRDGGRDPLEGAPESAPGAGRGRPADLHGDGFLDVAFGFGGPGEGSVRVLGGAVGHGRPDAREPLAGMAGAPWTGRSLTFAAAIFDRAGPWTVTNPVAVRITR